ncbi:MAG: ornithine carbamoyltransferase [Myxococcota bacterium]
MTTRHFIDVADYTSEDVRHLIEEARAIKASPHEYVTKLKGQGLALIFEKPSLRTRVSFDVGIHQLGGFSVYLSPAEINLGKRESIPDVARNLDRMVQGIMVRTYSHQIALDLAEHSRVPVINGLTDFSHPCQVMADYLTMLEKKGRLEGLKVAYVGDGNNVAHSLIHGAVLLGCDIRIGTPPGYEPDPKVIEWAKPRMGETGASLTLTNDAREAVEDADVVYTDVWASMGQEIEAEARREIFQPYQVDADLMAHAASDAIFMHCLPAHRGEEVTGEVIDSEQSVVFDQAENRLHAQKAIMILLME